MDDNKKLYPLTPKLIDGGVNKFAPFMESGTWAVRQSEDLKQLSESFDMGGYYEETIELTGLPDIWARPRFFEMALFNEEHPLHMRTVGEWRGLLTLLAFSDLRRFNVKTEIVDLGADQQSGIEFLDVVKQYIPTEHFYIDTNWSIVYIILFNNVPIGMTSPNTLVCTAANYFGNIKGVEWFNGHLLKDPISFLMEKDRKLLAAWLFRLAKDLINHPKTDIRQTPLIDLLNTPGGTAGFIQALGVDTNENIGSTNNTTLGTTRGIFKYINVPIVVKGSKVNSNVILISNVEPEPSPGILVLDDDLLEQWDGIPEHALVVSKSTMYSHVKSVEYLDGERTMIGDNKVLSGYEWRKASDFFTDYFYFVDQKEAFPGALDTKGFENLTYKGGTNFTPIVPLREEILKYLTVDEIMDRLTVTQDESAYTTTLRLTLNGPEGDGRDFFIKKTYDFKRDGIREIRVVPIFGIWPNFAINSKEADWSLYYTFYYSLNNNDSFTAAPYIRESEKYEDFGTSKSYYDEGSGNIVSEIYMLKTFPEAVVCKYSNDSTDVGLLLIGPPKKRITIENGKKWDIGIDFGTTSTNIYYRQKGVPKSMTFNNDLILNVTYLGQDIEYYYTMNFIRHYTSGASETTPFLSMYNILNASFPNPLLPLKDGAIAYIKSTEELVDAKNLRTDMKWGEKDEKVAADAFFKQVFMQCAAQAAVNAVDTVKWHYSYPVDFDFDTAYKSTWELILKRYSKFIPFKGQEQSEMDAKSESVAAAIYLSDTDLAPFEKGVVCIDIGGGTSDISFWYKKELIYENSILFAGRKIFLDIFKANPKFLKEFDISDSIINEMIERKNSDSFYALADVVIFQYAGNWVDDILRVSADEPPFLYFMHILATNIAAIFYYIGMLINALIRIDKFSGTNLPYIYFAGNGSKIFNWLNYWESSKQHEGFASLARDMLVKASGVTQNSPIIINNSANPKSEAAYGLVCVNDLSSTFDKENKQKGIVAGETISWAESSEAIPENSFVSAEDFTKGISLKDQNQFNKFIAAFNEYSRSIGSKEINVSNELTVRVRDKIEQELRNMEGKNINDILRTYECLFIKEYKFFIEEYLKEYEKNPNGYNA